MREPCMQHEFVSLNLSAPTDAVPSTLHAPLLDGVLALIRDMLAAEHEPKRTALAERFEEVKMLRKRVADLEKQARRQTKSGACSDAQDVER